MYKDLFDHLAHGERVTIALIVVDVASGNRRAREVQDEDFLIARQCVEAVRVVLHDRGVGHLFDEIRARHCGSSNVSR